MRQRNNFGDIESIPYSLKCAVDGTSSFEFWVGGNVIANEEEARVDRHELLDGNLGHWRIGGVGCRRCLSSHSTLSLVDS